MMVISTLAATLSWKLWKTNIVALSPGFGAAPKLNPADTALFGVKSGFRICVSHTAGPSNRKPMRSPASTVIAVVKVFTELATRVCVGVLPTTAQLKGGSDPQAHKRQTST